MAKKIGTLIREARTQAGMTQEALAKKIKGISARDISLADLAGRGASELLGSVLGSVKSILG